MPFDMWFWVDCLGVLLVDAAVSAVVLWAVAAVVMLGSRQPARRLLIARAATVGSFAFLPLIGLELIPQFDLLMCFEESGLRLHPATPWRLPSEPPGSISGDASVRLWSARALTLLYLGGTVGGLAWLALGYAGLARVIRGSCEASPESAALLAVLPYAGLRRRPGLRISPRIGRPVLVGIVRPLILIPPDLDQPEARDRLRVSLLHELAHAEVGDAYLGLLRNLAQVFWFFVPPVWWVASQMRLDQEFLADRRAAEEFGPVGEYASSLLALASSQAGALDPGTASETEARTETGGSPLFQRFSMLLRCPFQVEHAPPVWWTWGLPWLALAVTLSVSTLTVRYPSRSPFTGFRGNTFNTFRISRLEISPSAPDSQGRSPAVRLPIVLPKHFNLSVEVWSDLSTLRRMRLAGLPIQVTQDDPSTRPAGWHFIQLHHSPRETSLRVDGKKIALDSRDSPLTPWLSVEPAPERPASLQHLTLSW